MKRDMELIRKILIVIEDYPFTGRFIPLNIEGYPEQEIMYHIKMLAQEGLIEAVDNSSNVGPYWDAKSLTWAGHDFIEAIRDDTRWAKVKKWVDDTGKILVIETIKAAIKSLFT